MELAGTASEHRKRDIDTADRAAYERPTKLLRNYGSMHHARDSSDSYICFELGQARFCVRLARSIYRFRRKICVSCARPFVERVPFW